MPLLHLLRLLRVSLLHLLRLLLVLLFHLLRSGVICLLFRQLLVFLVLLLLQIVPLFLLICYQLVLFLLVFLILLSVSCVGSRGALYRRQILRMNRRSTAAVIRTPSRFSASHHAIALKISRSSGCHYSRLAMVERCALLRV